MLTANAAQLPDATHYLFLDTDIVPAQGAIQRLLDANLPVVSGAYYNSFLNGLAAWKDEKPIRIAAVPKLDDKGNVVKTPTGQVMAEPDKFIDAVTQRPIGPLVEVDKVGLGLCLFQKQVFDTLEEEGRPFLLLSGRQPTKKDAIGRLLAVQTPFGQARHQTLGTSGRTGPTPKSDVHKLGWHSYQSGSESANGLVIFDKSKTNSAPVKHLYGAGKPVKHGAPLPSVYIQDTCAQ